VSSAVRVTSQGQVRFRPQPDEVVYDNALGRMALKLDATTEADPVGVLGSLVAAAGVALGPDVRIRVGDSDHPLLAWFLLCGRTASGRKGTAGEVAHRVLSGALPAFCSDNVVSGLSSAEGLIAAVADPEEDDDEAKKEERSDKRLLVVENEFSVVLSRARREGNALSPVLREAWDGRDLRVLTKNPVKATRPHIGIVGHISPTEFRARVSQTDLAGGSYNRFLLLYVERSKMLPEGGGAAQDLVDKLAREVEGRIRRGRGVGTLTRAPDTLVAWAELYEEFVDLEDDEVLGPWVSRAVPYTLRLAGLYAALDGLSAVRLDHLTSAAAMVRYSMDSVRYVLDSGSRHSDVETIARLIKNGGPSGVPRSVITKAMSGRRSASDVGDLIAQVMEIDGFSQETLPSTGGRPPTVLRYAA
jgi:hypothetical protein